VLCIAHGNSETEHARTASMTLSHHLARHGVKAEASHDTTGEIDVADIILSRASDLQSDLLVMGAYGHSKLREMVLGGATRGLLEHMTVPVLMAH
jgi:nucleotide-binding universal stress UspA family protein